MLIASVTVTVPAHGHTLLTPTELLQCAVLGRFLKTIQKLQTIQNAVVWVVMGIPCYVSVTTLFCELCWFKIIIWVQCKILIITYKVLQGIGLGYCETACYLGHLAIPYVLTGRAYCRVPNWESLSSGGPWLWNLSSSTVGPYLVGLYKGSSFLRLLDVDHWMILNCLSCIIFSLVTILLF